ncbi:sarcosine oxidase subunit gamma [Futiania mangrovi]|uniref:Sarcosine oxidase subunit gamma n=1 Tax=Futiania mangrovi TaxID=2959716 RepID=A0A9J6PH69_9PROT|nr:sarcosine oxidase, gamma subunit [Futiania mangrovii]MCP1337846.1 sarcosine oxidase subunit gamma [Futiania mangrovii]
MSDPGLVPLTPLGGAAPRIDRIGAISIAEVADLALVSLAVRAGQENALAEAAASFLGHPLPGPGEGAARAFWAGPGQWMLHGRGAEHANLAARVKAAVGGSASVTDQSDAWAAFDVEGKTVAEMLARLCNLDAARMPAHAASRTLVEHLGCVVLCEVPARRYLVLGPRSAAASLHHALTAAAIGIA